jgi:hypothetical protein
LITAVALFDFANDYNTGVLRQTIAKVNTMGVEKTREELLVELRGLGEELARLNETISEYKQKYESAEEAE